MNLLRNPLLFAALLAATPPLPAAVDPDQLGAARKLFDAGKNAEAQAAFDKLAAIDGRDAELKYYLGELALRRDDADKAVALLEQATVAAPHVARYQQGLGDAYGRSAQKAS